jgi:HD superfamily phosphohydrolase
MKKLLPSRRSHEDWSRQIIDERFAAILREHDVDPSRVCALIHRNSSDANVPAYQRQIISSQLDVDRMDYLCRDAHFTGVPIGRVDLPYLTRNVQVITHGSQQTLGLTAKGVSCYETFAFARHIMNKTVYFHQRVAAFECMMETFIRLAIGAADPKHQTGVLVDLKRLIDSDNKDQLQLPMSLYLKLTEDQIWTAVMENAERSDQLGRIASLLLDRISMPSYAVVAEKEGILETELKSAGFDINQCCVRSLSSELYKQEGGEMVFVADDPAGHPEHVTNHSSLVKAFRDQTEGEAVLVILDESVKHNVLEIANRANCLQSATARGRSKPPVKVRHEEPLPVVAVRSSGT